MAHDIALLFLPLNVILTTNHVTNSDVNTESRDSNINKQNRRLVGASSMASMCRVSYHWTKTSL